MKKYIYNFNEGTAQMKDLLGGKGANLAEMSNIGLPVPFGFTITTEACNTYYVKNHRLWDELIEEIETKLEELENKSGKKFGDKENPLLVSVRSGAKFSMPGMMDTILNLGLNDDTVEALARNSSNERFAYDSYRRFIQMFGNVVMNIDKTKFDEIFDRQKKEQGVESDTELDIKSLKHIVKEFKKCYKEETEKEFPENPTEQLLLAIEAVFKSWNTERAVIYRRIHNISDNLGTAVNVQSMVFGNMGDDCGTGVAFTRNPATGEKKLFGEFLVNAQGEDVVAGIRTPLDIDKLKTVMPEIYKQFSETAELLENHYRDMQDIEFTIEKGKLFILQTRSGKRTVEAAVRIAVEAVGEGKLNEEEALLRVEPAQIMHLLHQTFDKNILKNTKPLAKGLPASPGAASGKIYFSASDAVVASKSGEQVILVRQETSPEDIEGMVEAKGILTSRGGMTSHAAVVARGMGKCCVAGCEAIKVNENAKHFTVDGKTFKEGDFISLNGSSGNVYEGIIPTLEPELSEQYITLMSWADKTRRLRVRANADTPKDAAKAVELGAEGIGLCRTEHMFFEEDRIAAVREMILADNVEQRRAALEKILPMQKEDFIGIYKAMGGRPITIRLLDPPLHEFLPKEDKNLQELADEMKIDFEKLKVRVEDLKEVNPMLGHRGCRLAISYPEIAEMQTRAIIEAAIQVKKEEGIDVKPEIMIPLVVKPRELTYIKEIVVKIADELIKESGIELEYLYGTMIEIPRACIVADDIAAEAEFFSFGTNDLTQMTYGLSRDDAGRVIEEYLKKKILDKDPFQSIDRKGVGRLMKMAVELGRKKRPDIKLGICGEHGGEPSSVEFCHELGLDYVSCSPFRVPIARLAAAQAAIIEKDQTHNVIRDK